MNSEELKNIRIDRAYNLYKKKRITLDELVRVADLTNKKFNSLKEWYKDFYPGDELGDDLKDVDILELYSNFLRGGNICEDMGVYDSIVRDRVLSEFSNRFNRSYYEIYSHWLNA